MTTLDLVVRARESVADDVIRLRLERPDGAPLPPWAPGAHVDLRLEPSDGAEWCGALVRQYSLCGDPSDAHGYEIAVLRVSAEAGGRGGSLGVHERLQRGAEVAVGAPRNHFALEPAEEYLFLAGGIGITPLRPMVGAARARGVPWRLVFGGRSRGSMAFADELHALDPERVRLMPQDEVGLPDLAAVLGEPRAGRRVYACGPTAMLDALAAVWGDPGCARDLESLHVERFAAAVESADAAEEAFEIEIASTGARHRVEPGRSILDVLDDAGIAVERSCQEGTCGTCETGLLAGVPEHRDVVLDEAEKAANDCLMVCVARCVAGPLVLDL